MKQRRILLSLAGLVVAAILAFFLQDVISRAVVTPLAYLWWVLKLIFAAIPQLILWILLLAVLILIVITSLLTEYPVGRANEKPSKPTPGPVENLSGWISNSGREGNYYKWMIASRLGKLRREMDGIFENRSLPAHPGEQATAGRIPPEAVERYLQAGLEESFVDYPLPPLAFIHRKATPFDIDVEQAVEFLESQIEDR